MKVLLLTTDAYGGHGGIALYNRDLAEAMAAMPEVREVVVAARVQRLEAGQIPAKIRYVTSALGGKLRYVKAAFALAQEHFDLLICGHVNLLPLAAAVKRRLRAPLVLMVYGIDVWMTPGWLTRRCMRAVDAVWTISAITRDKMNAWAALSDDRYTLLPNAIHLDRYAPGAKPDYLLERYHLQDATVLLTLGRLSANERYKGVDEMLEVLPALLARNPRVRYLLAGDGDDRARLADKARRLGVADQVVFAGFIDDAEKADHFRVADAFVMPGRGEGFGFVFLEALASGVPVVGSVLDGSREALRNGELGALVDPTDARSIEQGIAAALATARGVPQGLSYFAWPAFCGRVQASVHNALAMGRGR